MKILFRVILLILFVNYQNNQLTKNVSEKKITTYQKDFAKVDTIKTNSFLHLIARMEITEKYHLSRVGRYAYSSDSFLTAFSHTLYFSIKVFMVWLENSTVRMAVFKGSEIIFFRIRSGIKAAKALPVIIYTHNEFNPRLQTIVTSNTAIKICSHLSGLLYKKYP